MVLWCDKSEMCKHVRLSFDVSTYPNVCFVRVILRSPVDTHPKMPLMLKFDMFRVV